MRGYEPPGGSRRVGAGSRGPSSPPPPPVIELTPAAARFLDLMRDLGHLDERMYAAVLDALSTEVASSGGVGRVSIDRDQVRRLVAIGLFEIDTDLDREQAEHLHKEWTTLFA